MYMIKLIRTQLSATFYRRPFSSKMREIYEEHRSERQRHLIVIDCALLLYFSRLLWIVYLMLVDFEPIRPDHLDAMMRQDVILGFSHTNRHTYPPIFILMLYIFLACVLLVETLIWQIDPSTMTWRWWYELIVKSQDAYRAAMLPAEEIAKRRRQLELWYSGPSGSSRWVPSVAKGVYGSIVARVQMWWTLSSVDQQRLFAEFRLTALPNISRKLRAKAVVWIVATEYAAFCFQVTIVSLFIAFFLDMYGKENPIPYTTFARIRVTVELYFVHYVFQRVIHMTIYFTCSSIFGTMVFTGHVINITRPVAELIWRFRHRRPTKQRFETIESGRQQQLQPMLSFRKYGALITRQFVDHNIVQYIVLQGVIDLFGAVMFIFVITNIPINIYLIRQMWYTRTWTLQRISVSVIFGLQIFVATIGMVPLAWCCKIYHSPKHFILGFQAITGKTKWLQLKLKFDDLYGRLLRGPKFGLAIGTMETITYNGVFEFVLVYVAYLLMAFSQQIEYDLARSEEAIAELTENMNINVEN